jgi:hypothetical protein
MIASTSLDSELFVCSLLFLSLVAILVVWTFWPREGDRPCGEGCPPYLADAREAGRAPFPPAGSADRVPIRLTAIKTKYRLSCVGELYASVSASYTQQFEQAVKMIRL